MSAAAALRECPFCGSGKISRSLGKTGDGRDWSYVECEDCGASAEPEVWNRRGGPPEPLRAAAQKVINLFTDPPLSGDPPTLDIGPILVAVEELSVALTPES